MKFITLLCFLFIILQSIDKIEISSAMTVNNNVNRNFRTGGRSEGRSGAEIERYNIKNLNTTTTEDNNTEYNSTNNNTDSNQNAKKNANTITLNIGSTQNSTNITDNTGKTYKINTTLTSKIKKAIIIPPHIQKLLITEKDYLKLANKTIKLSNRRKKTNTSLHSIMRKVKDMSLIKNNTGRIINHYFPSMFDNNKNNDNNDTNGSNGDFDDEAEESKSKFIKKKKEMYKKIFKTLIIPETLAHNITNIIKDKQYHDDNIYKEVIVCDHPQVYTLSQIFVAFLYQKMTRDSPYTLSEMSTRVKFLCPHVEPIKFLVAIAEKMNSSHKYSDDDLYKKGLDFILRMSKDIFGCKLSASKYKILLFKYKEKVEFTLKHGSSGNSGSSGSKNEKACKVLERKSLLNLIHSLINIIVVYKKENNEKSNLQESVKLSRVFWMHLKEFKRLCV